MYLIPQTIWAGKPPQTSHMLTFLQRMRIAIIHVGAPAGGMNQATRAAVAYCLTRGHTPLAIHNGFPGLCRHHADQPVSSVREVTWLEADSWVNEGGSDIGTNRSLPSVDMEGTAKCFELYKFDAVSYTHLTLPTICSV